jgi:hypothetical protein
MSDVVHEMDELQRKLTTKTRETLASRIELVEPVEAD